MSQQVNAEAGDYLEDDPLAWEVFVGALRTYCGDIDALRERFGDKGYEIAAGAMLSYLADQHGVYIRREVADDDDLDDDVIDLRTGNRLPSEYMCPNCVTPWKCNGPHIPQSLSR